jgi:triacylglycerol lipase
LGIPAAEVQSFNCPANHGVVPLHDLTLRGDAVTARKAESPPSDASARTPPHLTPADAVSAPTWRAAYSDRTAALMATFSELAYLPFEEGGASVEAGEPRAERQDGRSRLASALAEGGFQLAATFNKDDTQGYLAVRPDQFAVLAFRGTTNFSDWKTNLNGGREPLRPGSLIHVHRGFLSAYRCCEHEIAKAVDALPGSRGLYITGHSLGGALAQIASAALERDTLAACYTFGSPRVGTERFDYEVKCPHYRLVNNWDIVPGVPPATPWGYWHSGDPRLLKPRLRDLLRHDRDPLSRSVVDLVALFRGLVSRRFLVVDDHMIWNYRRQLEGIAQRKNRDQPGLFAADAGR